MYMGLSAMASGTSVKNAEGVEIWYDFDSSTKTASVTYKGIYSGYYDDEYSGEVVIPSTVTYDGVEYSVTSIGEGAFMNCSDFTSVTIPEGVTSIGNQAFSSCSALTSITIPEGLTSIGNYAFRYCDSLTSITLPKSLTSIGISAFDGCSNLWVVINKSDLTITAGSYGNGYVAYYARIVTDSGPNLKTVGDYIFYADGDTVTLFAYTGVEPSITLPSDYEGKNYSIGRRAFYDCDSLTSVTIPEGVTSIGDYAFYDCDDALTSITISKSVTKIGESAFHWCSALTEVNYNGTIADWCGISFGNYSANPLYYGHLYIDGEEVKDLVIPSGVTAIKDYAFYNCDGLTSITIPESVTSIGDEAFYDCNALTSITLPKSLTSIGEDAFYKCKNLWVVINKSDLTITVGSDDNGYVAYYARIITDSESKVKTVDDYIFYSDGYTVELIAYISDETSITLPSDYEGKNYKIGYKAFYDCDSLTSVTIPEGVTEIGEGAFRSCSALTSITLPEGLTSIGYAAFSGTAFSNTESNWEDGVLYIGDYLIDAESDISGGYTVKAGTTLIGTHAFQSCDALTSIIIPEGVTSIGNYAFRDCSALTSITLPKGLTSIGDEAFRSCSALTEVNYNGTIADWCGISFGDDEANPLYYAKHLYIDGEEVKDLVIPSGVTAINNYAFYNCDGLTSVTLSEGLTSIGNNAFRSCSALTSIILPESLTSIGDESFYGCDKLDEVYNKSDLTITARSSNNGYVAYYANNAYNNVKTVGNYIFTVVGGTAELITYTGDETSLTLPSDCEGKDYKINYKAFYGCDALTSITIPKGVTSIGHSAFDGCSALTSITSKNTTPPTIGGKYTFDDVDKSIPVYVPKSSVDAYKGAEYWKDFTNIIGAYFVDVIAENGTVEGTRAYVENNEATLTATPNEGYKFVQWSDGVTDNTRTVVVVSDTTFTAVFELKEYTVAVTAKNGTVEGVGTYKHGAEAKLIVTPIEGYKFVKWSDGVTDNLRTIEVTSDLTLTAEIYKLCSVYATTENGFISGAGEYVDGDEVTLTATHFDGYEFFMWRDKYGNAVSFDANYTFTVTSDVELTAVFKEDDNPISDIQTSDVNVRLIGNNIVVEGADDYTVYSVSGQNLGKVESVERGVYIVVVNGKSYKVVAK